MSANFNKNGIITCTPIDGYDKAGIMKNDIIVGDNLCSNCHLPTLYSAAGTSVYTHEIVDDYGECTKITCTTSGSGGRYFVPFPKSSDKIGKVYTWSIDIKASRYFNITIGHECGGCTSLGLSSEWKRYSLSWTFTDSNYHAFIVYPYENAQVGDWVEVRNLKIEEGSKATPWCPNPADGFGNTPDTYKNPIQAKDFIEL